MTSHIDARSLEKDLRRDAKKRYAPNNKRASWELLVTIVPLLLCGLVLKYVNLYLGIPLVIFMGGLLVRLFTIQHDCGHYSMFFSKSTNDLVGRILGSITWTPYSFWKISHAYHHTASGNLDKNGIGEIWTLTVDEYLSRSEWEKFKYRAYRNPCVLFLVGPLWIFVIQQRYSLKGPGKFSERILSVWLTNAGIVLYAVPWIMYLGFWKYVFVQLSIIVFAGSVGVWLFYVQHQFEDAHFEHDDEWNRSTAALMGSSYYDLHPILNWFSGNIGIHHVHHLVSKIPSYYLPRVMRDYPNLTSEGINRITLVESFRCLTLKFWDNQAKKMVTLREIRP